METFVQSLVSGVLTGSLYAMIGVGLTVVFGVMRIINLAHGEMVMLGMFAAYFGHAKHLRKWLGLGCFLNHVPAHYDLLQIIIAYPTFAHPLLRVSCYEVAVGRESLSKGVNVNSCHKHPVLRDACL